MYLRAPHLRVFHLSAIRARRYLAPAIICPNLVSETCLSLFRGFIGYEMNTGRYLKEREIICCRLCLRPPDAITTCFEMSTFIRRALMDIRRLIVADGLHFHGIGRTECPLFANVRQYFYHSCSIYYRLQYFQHLSNFSWYLKASLSFHSCYFPFRRFSEASVCLLACFSHKN